MLFRNCFIYYLAKLKKFEEKKRIVFCMFSISKPFYKYSSKFEQFVKLKQTYADYQKKNQQFSFHCCRLNSDKRPGLGRVFIKD